MFKHLGRKIIPNHFQFYSYDLIHLLEFDFHHLILHLDRFGNYLKQWYRYWDFHFRSILVLFHMHLSIHHYLYCFHRHILLQYQRYYFLRKILKYLDLLRYYKPSCSLFLKLSFSRLHLYYFHRHILLICQVHKFHPHNYLFINEWLKKFFKFWCKNLLSGSHL